MEFDELFVPTDLSTDYATGVLTRIFGSIIPRLHRGGDGGVVVSNWLETIFTVFNTFCLLAMLIVLSYTIYVMIFDTAADGKTFGQSADTKYTILRTVLGFIGFVPVAGGFSLAQVAFLWLLIQGSAFGDTIWRATASNMLSGTAMTSGTISQIPSSQAAKVREFGVVFDTLVTSHLCGLNGNSIARMLSGDTEITEAEISPRGSAGAIREVTSGPDTEITSEGWVFNNRTMVEMSSMISFAEGSGGAAFGGRANYCGAVRASDTYTARESSGGGLEAGLVESRAQQQFVHLGTTVLPALSASAYDVALSIYNGERDQEALVAPARTAIYSAVSSYMGGPAIATSIDSSVVDDVHENLLEMVTTSGWMMAPIWQRGVAQTVSSIEMPGDTLNMEVVRENRIADFLSGRGGYRSERGNVQGMIAKADADQDRWDEIAGYVRNLPMPDAPTDVMQQLGGDQQLTQSTMNYMYRTVLDFFSPVAGRAEAGNYGFVDPMLQLQRQGQILVAGGSGALAAGTVMATANGSILGRGADFIFGTGEAVGGIAGSLVSAGLAIIVTGLIMITVLPLVPMIYFYTAVLSWLFQTVELMFAIPLAILQLFTPSREATLLGNFMPVLLAAFGVFMRPFFMVIGMILAMMIISVSLTYLHELFSYLLFFESSSSTLPGGGFGALPAISMSADIASGLIKMIFYLIVYVLVAFLTVLYGSQIISEFGDFAMQMIGAASSRFSQPAAIADKAVLAGGLGYMGARNAASGLAGPIGQKAVASARGRIGGRGGNNRSLSGPD